MFDLYNHVFKTAKKSSTSFEDIEILRKRLLNNSTLLQVTDLGAGSKVHQQAERTVAAITKSTSKAKKYNRFLAVLTQYLKCQTVLELGTSVGISTLYLSRSGAQQVITIEGCANIAAVAQQNFDQTNSFVIRLLQGPFDDLLPSVLQENQVDLIYIDGNHTYEATKRYFDWCKAVAHNNMVIVLDDIYWSEGMTKAWNEIVSDAQTTATVDMFEFGLVFFRKELSKQHFVLKY